MLKRLAILAIIDLAILAPVGPQDASSKHQTKTQDSPPSPVTIVDNSSRQTQAPPTEQKAPESHTGIEWANWALVVVGAITFGAIWKQAKESAKATKAMRDSLALQEKAMEQWIVLDNWKARIFTNSPIAEMRIQVDMVNQTEFPLTLTSGTLIFTNNALSPPITVTWEAGINTFLPPKIPNTIRVSISIGGDQLRTYESSNLIPIRVEGEFTHIGALKKPTPQRLLGTLLCVQDLQSNAIFQTELHMNPWTEKDQPNTESGD